MKSVNNDNQLKFVINQVVMSGSKIDKISLTFDIKDENHQQFMKGYIWDLKTYPVSGAMSVAGSGYKANLKFNGIQSDGSPYPHCILLQLAPYKATAQFARLEWNPGKVTPAQWFSFLKFVFDQLDLDLPKALKGARVTRLDICRDVCGVGMEDFFSKASRKRHALMYYGSSGQVETIYHGKQSGAQVRIYDKRKQAGLDEPVTRFEVSVVKPFMLIDILNVANPFLNIKVFDLKPHGLVLDPDLFICFRDSCRLRGVKNALKLLSPASRKVFTKLIKDARPSWWQVEKGWEQDWIKAVTQAYLLPEQISVSPFVSGTTKTHKNAPLS